MKAKPLRKTEEKDGKTVYVPCEPAEATHVKLSYPGPYAYRIIPVTTPGGPQRIGCWTWNGDVNKPTLMPSILTTAREDQPCCHSFVSGGKVRFLNDCTHALAGMTVDLFDVDEE